MSIFAVIEADHEKHDADESSKEDFDVEHGLCEDGWAVFCLSSDVCCHADLHGIHVEHGVIVLQERLAQDC